MKGLSFDVKGTVAHFRKPDTTATQMTYPFITPTAIRGLVGAVLGIEDFVTEDKVGLKILNTIQTVTQQMSMLGKDGGTTFNRPTTIELIINPHYRIYYAGHEYVTMLAEQLEKEHAVYPTFLGCAYALTKPVLNKIYVEGVDLLENTDSTIETTSVVPTVLIKELQYQSGECYCRAGGFMYKYKGNRVFEKSINFIYEQEGKSISFIPTFDSSLIDAQIAYFRNELICLF